MGENLGNRKAKKGVKWPLIACLALLSWLPMCLAQTSSATLSGSVADPSGAVIPEAQIAITNLATGDIRRSVSNVSGEFTFAGLLPGSYTLLVTHPGFEQFKAEQLLLQVGDRKAVQVKLTVGAVTQIMAVSADQTLITPESGDVSSVIDRKFVDSMPLNGRSFQELILLVPGAITNNPQTTSANDGQSGQLSVNGQGSSSNAFLVDGVSANVSAGNTGGYSSLASSGALPASTALGTTQSIVPVDDLQEFRILTSSYSAEYGRNSGAQVLFSTRSGTNNLHGSGFDFLRNNVFDANDWFNNYYSVKQQPLRQNDFGGTLGGPVYLPHLYDGRNRTFFFVNYEGLRLTQPIAAYPSYVPDSALRASAGNGALGALIRAFPVANGPDLGDGLATFVSAYAATSSINSTNFRLDHAFSDNEKVFFRFSDTPSYSLTSALASKKRFEQNTQTETFGLTSVFSPNKTGEFRLNFSSNHGSQVTSYWQQPGAIPADLVALTGYPPSLNRYYIGLNLTFTQSTGESVSDGSNDVKQLYLADSFTWAIGSHLIKLGVDYRRLASTALASSPNLGYSYYSAASVAANQFDYADIYAFSNLYPVYHSFAAFAQDEWNVNPRLHLSFGLRWDLDPPPGSRKGPLPYALLNQNDPAKLSLAPLGTPIFSTNYHNFAPRFGLAYSAHTGPHQTVLRVGGGLFYDLITDAWDILANYYGPGFSAGSTFCPASYCTVKLPSYGLPVSSSYRLPQIVQPPVPPYRLSFPIPPNLTLPYSIQYNAAIQQNIGPADVLTASYVGNVGRKIIGNIESYVTPVNPDFTYLLAVGNFLKSSYNSAQVQYQHQTSHHVNIFAGYTWQHTIGEQQINSYAPYVVTNSGNGNGRFPEDVRQVANIAVTWDVPSPWQAPILKALAAGWGVDVRLSLRTGFPLLLVGPPQATPSAGGASVQWGLNFVPGEPEYLYNSNLPGGKRLNPAGFVAAPPGSVGDVPLNSFRGFGENQLDLSVRRTFKLSEKFNLLFRAEAFNVINHPNFGTIDSNLGDPTFGEPINMLATGLGALSSQYQSGGPRSMQFALRLSF